MYVCTWCPSLSPSAYLSIHQVIEGLGLTKQQFIDLCIMCGCDYCGTIRGIGPKSALNYIKKHGTIEKALAGE